MKSVLWILAVALCASAVVDAQHGSVIPVVNVDRPTIVAFFSDGSQTRSEDGDASEALSDFEFYADRVKEPLNHLGIEFTEQFGRSFRIRVEKQTRLFTPKPDTCGYYFIARGKKPHVEYGVMTDTDLLLAAKQYFAVSEMESTYAPPNRGDIANLRKATVQADRIEVFNMNGLSVGDRVYVSESHIDLAAFTASLKRIVPSQLCACAPITIIRLYRQGKSIGELGILSGDIISFSTWSGDGRIANTQPWLDWLDTRGITLPRKMYEAEHSTKQLARKSH